MDPKPLVLEDFADKLGQSFKVLDLGEIALDLTLTEADPLPTHAGVGAGRPPFSLVFTGRPDCLLRQQIHRLAHAGLGELEIFLVPIGRDAAAASYQAVFN